MKTWINRISVGKVVLAAALVSGLNGCGVLHSKVSNAEVREQPPMAVYKKSADKSTALNVLHAANIDRDMHIIHDGKLLNGEMEQGKVTDNAEGIVMTGMTGVMAAQGFAGQLARPSWMKTNVSGGLYAADLLLKLAEKRPFALRNHWIAWEPYTEYKLNTKNFRQMLMDAYAAALPNGYTLRKLVNTWKPTLNNTIYTDDIYLVVGDGCGTPTKAQLEDLKFTTVHVKREYCLARKVSHAQLQKTMPSYVTNSPDWLGGGKTLGYGVITEQDGYYVPAIGQRFPRWFKNVPALAKIDDRQFALEMTKHLPKWAYFYSAPNRRNGGYPVIMNQGNLEYFIR